MAGGGGGGDVVGHPSRSSGLARLEYLKSSQSR